jgi:hypothetical protein
MSTDIEIIEDAVQTLGSISIPVSLFKTVGIPVARVHANLEVLLEAVKKMAKEQQNKEEPSIEILDEEPVEETEAN